MNKPEVETMSIDDLYNNFKIIEQKVKKSVGTSSGAQNLAFMTAPSTSSTNDANTASPQVSVTSPNVNAASPQVCTASISDNTVYAFMVENPNGSNLLHQDLEQIHKDDLEAMDLKYDKSKVECYNYHKLGNFVRECRAPRSKEGQFRNQDNTRKQGNNKDTSSKAMLVIDGVGFDWSDMAEEQVQTNMALMAFFRLRAATYKKGLATIEAQLITYRKNEVLFREEVAVLKREVACKDYQINVLKSEFEKVKQEKDGIDFKIEKFDKASKDLGQLLGSQITDKSKKGLGYSAVPPPYPLIYNRPKKLDMSYSGLDEFKEPEFKGYGPENKEQVSQSTSSFVESSPNVDKETVFPVNKKINYDNHQRKGIVSRNNYNRVDAKTTHPSVHMNMSPKAVLLKTGLTPLNTVMLVNTAHPKTIVHIAKSKTHFSKQAQSTAKRPYYKQTSLTKRSVHAAKRHYYTGRPKAVNTARSYTGQVNVVRVKGGKPQHDDKGFVDSGCSRHMTVNIAYHSNFKEFDGGYVAFGGGTYGGRITGKGTLKTNSLDFEDVYFVNELKFNLFSVSQMCDKKNYVLFTDTECLVLSPNFKLPDENQILFKIPRKENMYSFDMKNIVPKESLTCLVAKATLDESMLWHRRLGHINFKNINKLVKDNLVRGLPTKCFENDQTCVACLKGKQHRASCKSKVLNPITKPLFMLYMDLFGPTFINCDNHQRKGIVARNNYNRVDAKTTHPSIHMNMSPKAVLLKTGLTPLNTVMLVNIAHPKTAVHIAKSKTHFSKQAQSTAKRPYYKQTALTKRSVHAAKRHYYTGRPKAVNTARSYTGQVNVVRVKGVNTIKSSAYWVWRPTKPNGASLAFKRHNYIDARGRSKASHNMMIKDLLTVDAQGT
ncbi:putative ribonuclease H-like domain-containing protein [Tanacetum coccineum]|uniref:Ribonuclease H-like domain-containing protein n=1 Tax=Tanacetum coccineum TaxID=301880 RepID=A0ABQ4XT95_9ASTR